MYSISMPFKSRLNRNMSDIHRGYKLFIPEALIFYDITMMSASLPKAPHLAFCKKHLTLNRSGTVVIPKIKSLKKGWLMGSPKSKSVMMPGDLNS